MFNYAGCISKFKCPEHMAHKILFVLALGLLCLLASTLYAADQPIMHNVTDKPGLRPSSQPDSPPPSQAQPDKPASEPQSGQRLAIPPQAAENNDLSFLEGCWVNTSRVYEQSEKRIITLREYCFSANGNGQRTIREQNGTRTCQGNFTSYFDANGVLHVKSSAATCNDLERSQYLPDALRCTGSGASTRCTGFGTDPRSGRNWQWEADFRRK